MIILICSNIFFKDETLLEEIFLNQIKIDYWKKSGDEKIECGICPRYCKLDEGQHGFCYVRGRENDQMVLHTYGLCTGLGMDPIEKKPLNHFYPGTGVLSFGTIGCNLGCKFCQNWHQSKAKDISMYSTPALPEEIVNIAKTNKAKSIAFTYNDPVIFFEYARDVALIARDEGIKTVAVTAGYINPEPRKEFFSFIDAANVDLKAFNDDFYKKLCGAKLQPVLDTLKYIKDETDVWLEITTLLILGENDSKEEINEMTRWIEKHLGPFVPVHFSAFHPCYKMNDINRTPVKTLQMARDIALDNGLRYVFTGNVHDKEGSSTYCHECGKLLIGRDWFQLSDWNVDNNGCCKYCKTKVYGVFN